MASILRRGDSYSGFVSNTKTMLAGSVKAGRVSNQEGSARPHLGRERTLDGTFLIPDAMTVAEMLYKWPHPVQQAQVGTQNLHPHGSHDSESCRALSRQEADSEGSDV